MTTAHGRNGESTPDDNPSDKPGSDDSQDSSDWTDDVEVENVEKEDNGDGNKR